MDLVVRTYEPADAGPIAALQAAYAHAFPEATAHDAGYIGGFYGHPAFDGGRNIYCALAGPRLVACGFLFPKAPAGGSRFLFLDLRADPTSPDGPQAREALFARLVERAREIAEATPERTTRLQAVHFAGETGTIEYLLGKGFAHYESGYMMACDLSLPIPSRPAPQGIRVRAWRMESEAEQVAYLQAYNQAFPEAPRALEDLQYFLGSPMWQVGTSFTAFAGEQVAGSLLAYWNEEENGQQGQLVGSTEEIFVLPPWRRQGIGRCLIAEGLQYLRAHGLAEAHLEMSSTNAPALALYRSMGYRVYKEEIFLARDLGQWCSR